MRCECGSDPVSESSERVVYYCGTVKTRVGNGCATQRGERCSHVSAKAYLESEEHADFVPGYKNRSGPVESLPKSNAVVDKTPYQAAVELMDEFFPRLEHGPCIRSEMREKMHAALVTAANRELQRRRTAELELAELKQRVALWQGNA